MTKKEVLDRIKFGSKEEIRKSIIEYGYLNFINRRNFKKINTPAKPDIVEEANKIFS